MRRVLSFCRHTPLCLQVFLLFFFFFLSHGRPDGQPSLAGQVRVNELHTARRNDEKFLTTRLAWVGHQRRAAARTAESERGTGEVY